MHTTHAHTDTSDAATHLQLQAVVGRAPHAVWNSKKRALATMNGTDLPQFTCSRVASKASACSQYHKFQPAASGVQTVSASCTHTLNQLKAASAEAHTFAITATTQQQRAAASTISVGSCHSQAQPSKHLWPPHHGQMGDPPSCKH